MCRINNLAYIAHEDGIYEFNCDNGSYKLLKKNFWKDTKKIMAYNGYLYILHAEGLFKINKKNGNYSRIGTSTWANAIRNCTVNFGKEFYVLYDNKIYWRNLENGSYSEVNNHCWKGSLGLFKGSDVEFPLTGGKWKKIFQVINPMAQYQDSFKYKIGSITVQNSLTLCLSVKFENTMKAAVEFKVLFSEEDSATLREEIINQLKKKTSESF